MDDSGGRPVPVLTCLSVDDGRCRQVKRRQALGELMLSFETKLPLEGGSVAVSIRGTYTALLVS